MSDNKILILIVSSICFISIVLDTIFPVHHGAEFWWHSFIGFDLIYGVFGSFFLFGVGKMLLPLIERKEDPYKRGEE